MRTALNRKFINAFAALESLELSESLKEFSEEECLLFRVLDAKSLAELQDCSFECLTELFKTYTDYMDSLLEESPTAELYEHISACVKNTSLATEFKRRRRIL